MTDTEIPWTLFWDMHSGGGSKEGSYDKIYIQAPQDEAELIFYNRFGHAADRVSCTCCGDDYSVSEEPTLAEASAYHRGCAWDKATGGFVERPDTSYRRKPNLLTVEEYAARPDVLVVYADDIKEFERHGAVPQSGYVWVD